MKNKIIIGTVVGLLVLIGGSLLSFTGKTAKSILNCPDKVEALQDKIVNVKEIVDINEEGNKEKNSNAHKRIDKTQDIIREQQNDITIIKEDVAEIKGMLKGYFSNKEIADK